jgi:hypothetical protein
MRDVSVLRKQAGLDRAVVVYGHAHGCACSCTLSCTVNSSTTDASEQSQCQREDEP